MKKLHFVNLCLFFFLLIGKGELFGQSNYCADKPMNMHYDHSSGEFRFRIGIDLSNIPCDSPHPNSTLTWFVDVEGQRVCTEGNTTTDGLFIVCPIDLAPLGIIGADFCEFRVDCGTTRVDPNYSYLNTTREDGCIVVVDGCGSN